MTQQKLSIPFRGTRDYVRSVDLIDDALARLRVVNTNPSVVFSSYSVMKINDAIAEISDTALSPKEYDTVVRVAAPGKPETFVGYIEDTDAPVKDERLPCDEADHKATFSIEGNEGTLDWAESYGSSPIAATVIATKFTSEILFPDPDVRWKFAAANLTALPNNWKQIKVSTDTAKGAKFYKWSVMIDGEPCGHIVFFYGVA